MKHPLDEIEDAGISHIVELGIDMALRTQDPDRLRTMLESSLPMYLEETLDGRADAKDAWRPLATELSRTIWNVTPLPDHDFSPRPLPRPGRNSPCPCGSGTKYKRCCGRANLLPLELTQEVGWLFALRCLSRKNIEAAIERRRVPVGVLAEHAKILPLLKPLFAGERLAGTAGRASAHATGFAASKN